MNISKELKKKMNVILKNNGELKDKILKGDVDAIRQITLMARKEYINPEYIVEAYEKNDAKKMEIIYKKAKREVELQKLYRELCRAYYEENIIDEER